MANPMLTFVVVVGGLLFVLNAFAEHEYPYQPKQLPMPSNPRWKSTDPYGPMVEPWEVLGKEVAQGAQRQDLEHCKQGIINSCINIVNKCVTRTYEEQFCAEYLPWATEVQNRYWKEIGKGLVPLQ